MADGLERRPSYAPSYPPSRDSNEPLLQFLTETTFRGQPALISILRKQLSVVAKAHIPNDSNTRKIVGRVTTEFTVVNSLNMRILSIRGAAEARRTLHFSLIAFAKSNGLNILPSERMDEATKQWLTESGLPDRYLNPSI
jgi:hypothetical protein